MTIHIFGSREDPHVSRVWEELPSRLSEGVNLFDIDDQASSTFSMSQNSIRLNDYLLSPDDVIWWRFKMFPRKKKIEFASPTEHDFWLAEWRSVFYYIGLTHPDAKQLNPYFGDLNALNKLYQRDVAKEVGFHTPEFVLTNEPKIGISFLDQYRSVYKPLTSAMPSKELGNLFTEIINVEKIRAADKEFQTCPNSILEYIEKRHELRVNVIGDQFFTTKIDSQKHKVSEIDWRTAQFDGSVFEPWELSDDVKQKCQRYMRRMGLFFGVIDLIVTPDDQTVFLECNNAGQWLFIEHFTSQPISSAIAGWLAKVHGEAIN